MYSDLQPNMLYCWKWGCWTPLKKTRELEPPAHTAGAQQCLLPVPPHQFQPRPMILPLSKAHPKFLLYWVGAGVKATKMDNTRVKRANALAYFCP